MGNKTVEQENSTINSLGMNTHINRNVDSDRILTPERISTFLEGETIVLAPLKRQDLKGHKYGRILFLIMGKRIFLMLINILKISIHRGISMI
ncbi:hypothetical protein CEQ10_016850 [Enterococcus faecium]|nr:hypothetical protein CEQ10_016850 [Enterococcus faecium]